jgi:hypothetical protein
MRGLPGLRHKRFEDGLGKPDTAAFDEQSRLFVA